jgi:hypothetical protein
LKIRFNLYGKLISVKKLRKYPEQEAIDMIHQSIENTWQGNWVLTGLAVGPVKVAKVVLIPVNVHWSNSLTEVFA